MLFLSSDIVVWGYDALFLSPLEDSVCVYLLKHYIMELYFIKKIKFVKIMALYIFSFQQFVFFNFFPLIEINEHV